MLHIGDSGSDKYDLLWHSDTQYAAGVGWIYPLIERLCSGKKGLDIGGSGWTEGAKPVPGTTIVDPQRAGSGDAYNLSMYDDESYDFAIFSHVLEHLDDPEKAMVEVRRKLVPEGLAICYCPHPDHDEWNPKKNPACCTLHLWQPTATSMGRLLLMTGYEVLYSEVEQDRFGSFLTIGKKVTP